MMIKESDLIRIFNEAIPEAMNYDFEKHEKLIKNGSSKQRTI